MSNPILVEIDGPVATITLNRPDDRNALSQALRADFAELLSDGLDGVVCAVVTGAGPAFCAGMDKKEKMGPKEGASQWNFFQSLFDARPVLIAAVNGPARGAGNTLLAACDLAYADPTADFAMPQIGIGFYSGIAGAVLQQILPPKIAAELILTGLPISAERAAEIGMVNEVTSPGAALARAQEMAERIATFKPEVVAAARRGLNVLPHDRASRDAAVQRATGVNRELFGEPGEDRHLNPDGTLG